MTVLLFESTQQNNNSLFFFFGLFDSVATEYLMGINIKDNEVTTEKQAKKKKNQRELVKSVEAISKA